MKISLPYTTGLLTVHMLRERTLHNLPLLSTGLANKLEGTTGGRHL